MNDVFTCIKMHTVWHLMALLQFISFINWGIKCTTELLWLIREDLSLGNEGKWHFSRPLKLCHLKKTERGHLFLMLIVVVSSSVITNGVAFFTVKANGVLTLQGRNANSHHSCTLRPRARVDSGVKGHPWCDLILHNQWTQGPGLWQPCS